MKICVGISYINQYRTNCVASFQVKAEVNAIEGSSQQRNRSLDRQMKDAKGARCCKLSQGARIISNEMNGI